MPAELHQQPPTLAEIVAAVRSEVAELRRPKVLLSVDESARRCNMSVSTLYELLASGRYPQRVRCGRTVSFLESDIDAWIEARAREVGSESWPNPDTSATPPLLTR